MSKKSTANKFGESKNLVGSSHKGQEITYSSRKYFRTMDGTEHRRSGEVVTHNSTPSYEDEDDQMSMTDEL